MGGGTSQNWTDTEPPSQITSCPDIVLQINVNWTQKCPNNVLPTNSCPNNVLSLDSYPDNVLLKWVLIKLISTIKTYCVLIMCCQKTSKKTKMQWHSPKIRQLIHISMKKLMDQHIKINLESKQYEMFIQIQIKHHPNQILDL